MLDGALVDKTLPEANDLISTMTENSQNIGTRASNTYYFSSSKKVNELRSQLSNLITLAMHMTKRVNQQVIVFRACGVFGHSSDKCPEIIKKVNVIGGFLRKYNPHSNMYSSKWRDHPHLRWRSQGNQNIRPSNPPSSSSLAISFYRLILSR